jgi:hypothetical protein
MGAGPYFARYLVGASVHLEMAAVRAGDGVKQGILAVFFSRRRR